MRHFMLCLPAVVALGACGAETSPFAVGFNPEAPTEGQLQVYTPIIKAIPPGKDITYCSYLDYSTEHPIDIKGYKGFQTAIGHHSILYSATHTQPVGTHECTEDDMTNVHYLAGGGADATVQADELPAGIVFRVKEHTQLMIVSHFINSTDKAVDGQTVFNVSVENPNPQNLPADLFTSVNTQFSVPEGDSVVHTDCTVQMPMTMVLVGPHAHEHATHMTITKIDANGPSVVQDIPWTPEMVFNTPLQHYSREQPFQVAAGDTFSIECSFHNTTGAPIPFPSEMCVSYGYFFPADHEIDCIDGSWPTE